MPKGPAARITDMTAHGGPLVPGPPSPNVIIGKLPAWLGLTAAAAAALAQTIAEGAKNIADKTAKVAAAKLLPPPGGAAAVVKAQKDLVEATAKAAADTAGAMMASGVSFNLCPIVKLLVPDGIGVDITPSQTVLINKWGACRVGDTIQEVTSVNTIVKGEMTVIIGG